jgi:hypothetical protein
MRRVQLSQITAFPIKFYHLIPDSRTVYTNCNWLIALKGSRPFRGMRETCRNKHKMIYSVAYCNGRCVCGVRKLGVNSLRPVQNEHQKGGLKTLCKNGVGFQTSIFARKNAITNKCIAIPCDLLIFATILFQLLRPSIL